MGISIFNTTTNAILLSDTIYIRNHAFTLSLSLSIALALSSVLFIAPQAAQATMYAPGATLDPACAPTDSNCGVQSNTAVGTLGQVPYYAAAGNVLAATSTMTILSNGNVGIGTTTPSARLVISGGSFKIKASGSPILKSTYSAAGITDVYVSGKYAYVADTYGLEILDISDPTSPVLVGGYALPAGVDKITVQGKYAYVTGGGPAVGIAHPSICVPGGLCNGFLIILDVSNVSAPTFVGGVSNYYGGTASMSKTVVSGRYVYVAYTYGMSVIDVIDPANPKIVWFGPSWWGWDITRQGQYVYEADGGTGLVVFDVSNPAVPVVKSTTALNYSSGVAVSGRYAYVTGLNGDLKILDISNPTSPVVLNTISGSYWKVKVFGNYAYVVGTGGIVDIYDVSNPLSPVQVGTYNTGTAATNDIFISGDRMYVVAGTQLQIVELNSIETPAIYAGNLKAGYLTVEGSSDITNGLTIGTTLNVGGGGILTEGFLTVRATSTPSTFLGNVGIGTTSPSARLTVWGADTSSAIMANFVNSARTSVMSILNNGNVGIGTTTPTGILNIAGVTPKFTITNNSGAVDGKHWFLGNASGDFSIGTTSDSLATNTTYLTVKGSTGNVGIGTTSPFANLSVHANNGSTNTTLFAIASSTASATTTLFSVANTGNVTINGSSGSTCTIGNGVGATSCTSDERLKTNIALIIDPLKSIEQLRGVTFNWKDPTKNQQQFIGVIAQDVQKVFPQAVVTNADGYLAVDYAVLVAPLIEAVKELAGKVSTLAATVAGFADTFTTNNLCVKKSDGSKVCITGDQLNAILQNNGQQSNFSQSNNPITITDVSPADTSASTTDSTVTTTSDTQATTTPDTASTTPAE